ncbi:MAG: RagB/SusD family nutrient uptake outer membrane protein [Gemmatimonadaceae bacterium]
MTRTSLLPRALACAALLGAATACSDFLKVENPGAEPIDKIGDPAYATLLVNGAIREFQKMIGDVALYSGDLSDEITAAHSNNSYRDLDRRVFDNSLDLVSLSYSPIQRARFAADTAATILMTQDGDKAGADPQVARLLALGGYSRVILGETFCEAPLKVSAPYKPDSLFRLAIVQFDSAITIATAAKAAGNLPASADSILNLALVGAARAALNAGDKTKAIEYASKVAPGFDFRIPFAEGIPTTPGYPINPFWNATGVPGTNGLATSNSSNGIAFSSASLWYIAGPTFQGLNDQRMPITSARVSTMSTTAGLSTGFVPLRPKSFGGWTATGTPISPGSSMRIASYVEAQYIIHEAEGGTAATLAFINGERAQYQPASDGPSTAATPDAILAELRNQRRREFYLDGHRLGDLRRYKAQYGLDYFTQGDYPNTANKTGSYGSATCMPVPVSEYNGNPNMPRG